MAGNNDPILETFTVEGTVLHDMLRDKLGNFGTKIWLFCGDVRRAVSTRYPQERAVWQFPEEAFLSNKKSTVTASGFTVVPDSAIQDALKRLDSEVSVNIRKFQDSQGRYSIIFNFSESEPPRQRDHSPKRLSPVVEQISTRRSKKAIPSKAPVRAASSSESYSQSEGGSSSSSSEQPMAAKFRRSKTPGRGRSRSKSVPRKELLQLSEEEAEKISRQLSTKDVDLVQVEPKKKPWSFF